MPTALNAMQNRAEYHHCRLDYSNRYLVISIPMDRRTKRRLSQVAHFLAIRSASPVSKRTPTRRVAHRKEGPITIIKKKHICPEAKHRKEAHLIRTTRSGPASMVKLRNWSQRACQSPRASQSILHSLWMLILDMTRRLEGLALGFLQC